MNNSEYFTTSIPYVNAPPHVGFATELVQADALARIERLRGHNVRLQTGTDENAFKNVLSARALGIPVRKLVEQNSACFKALCDTLQISNDSFVRTSESPHHLAVHHFLSELRAEDVYVQEYRGLYCTGCEDFYLERDLIDNVCPDHHTRVTEVAERNYFFRLSNYQDQLRELVASRRIHIVPESREREVLSFIDRGLTDISLSRDASRSAGWGVPYPNDDSQVVYVWIDALVNYLSGLDYPNGARVEQFWNSDANRTHVIGKNVWKFHAVYWPALLLSAGLPVPNKILVHGFLTIDGQKISKSSGNAPDPTTYVSVFGVDAVRYFLLRHIHPFEDTDFSLTRLAELYEADLANGLGNLCSRLTTLAETVGLELSGGSERPKSLPEFDEHVAAFRLDLALEVLWAEIRLLNQQLSFDKPWTDIREGRTQVAREKLAPVARRLSVVAYWLAPFLGATAAAIQSALKEKPIRKCAPLFPRRE